MPLPPKKMYSYLFVIMFGSSIFLSSIAAQIKISTLEELIPYLDDNNVAVQLSPGTYTITKQEVSNGKYGNPILLFKGSGSTYDFTGVTIKFDTGIFQSFGRVDVKEIQILGNDNVLKNLTMIDDGDIYDRPSKTALGIAMDGSNNRVEGFHMTVKGSWPYGYGDAFGKGGNDVKIRHHKHSALLVRGESNHVKNCTIIHRAYGHAIFMQASNNALIEGCYVEGEVRSTDDMLTETGTGSPADDIDFMTSWGYKLPPGYMMSLQEEGIRAYNGGETFINGKRYERGTSNPTILNCTVKNMRGGVTITHATGKKYVEGCTTIGCERGYAIGSGAIVASSSDAKYGPVFGVDYESDRNMEVDLTILTDTGDPYGTHHAAYIGGSGHQLTFRSSEENPDPNMKIQFGALNSDVRLIGKTDSNQNNHSTKGIALNNYSKFAVHLSAKSSSISGTSCGPITDNGNNNNVLDCFESQTCEHFDAFARIQAEDYCLESGVNHQETNIGSIQDGDWIGFDGVDFGDGSKRIRARVASNSAGGTIELRLNSSNGRLVGSLEVSHTGGWDTWTTISSPIAALSGLQKIYLVFNGNSSGLFDIDWIQFIEDNTLNTENYNSLAAQVNLFPNPVHDHLYLQKNSLSMDDLRVQLLNLKGQILHSSQEIDDHYKIDMSALVSGVYLLKITNKNQTVTRKIIKN